MSATWIVPIGGSPDAPVRLFVPPFAGGGSVPWRAWGPLVPDGLRLDFIQLPGREQRFREPAFTAMADLLPAVLEGLTPHLDRPFAFFGHSMGASIAYELARLLEAEGRAPRHLFVSGRRAPGHPRMTPVIHHLPDAGFKEALGRLGGTPKEVLANDELMEMFLPVLRADFKVSDSYTPAPGAGLTIPLSVFGGTEDPETDEAALRAWEAKTTGPFEMEILAGDHFFIGPHKAHIMSRIGARLAV